MVRRPGLSKSRLTAFEQCPKRLWLQIHRPDLAETDERAEARFAAGHEVGAVACSLVPQGVMIEAEPDLAAALDRTRELIATAPDRPLFEAAFEHDGVLVRCDILEPDGQGGYAMAEVKSSTAAKPYHIADVATQIWVARGAGVAVSAAVVRHIDNRFVLGRQGEYRGLFADADVLAEAEPIARDRGRVVAAARRCLAGPQPDIAPGAQCSDPFACEFASHCGSVLPKGPDWPVTILPRGGGRAWLDQGIEDLLAVDPKGLPNATQRRIHHATRTGQPFHDIEAARIAMAGWAFPRTWLDFETIGFAVPRWIGTRPYQNLPFQFSAHVEDADGEVAHHEFLSLDGADPRRACAEALLAAVPTAGAIIAYSASFERGVIRDLAQVFPDLSAPLAAMAERVVDLLPVARETWYHRDQRGSWSIKAVLPTIAPDLNYSNLEVGDGQGAQGAYLEATAKDTDPERRAQIASALSAYCARDTWAMIAVARRLAGLS